MARGGSHSGRLDLSVWMPVRDRSWRSRCGLAWSRRRVLGRRGRQWVGRRRQRRLRRRLRQIRLMDGRRARSRCLGRCGSNWRELGSGLIPCCSYCQALRNAGRIIGSAYNPRDVEFSMSLRSTMISDPRGTCLMVNSCAHQSIHTLFLTDKWKP